MSAADGSVELSPEAGQGTWARAADKAQLIAAALLAASGSSTSVGMYVTLGVIVSIVGAFALDRYAPASEGDLAS